MDGELLYFGICARKHFVYRLKNVLLQQLAARCPLHFIALHSTAIAAGPSSHIVCDSFLSMMCEPLPFVSLSLLL